jgi:DNA-binding beta-propeller fold protein YncE
MLFVFLVVGFAASTCGAEDVIELWRGGTFTGPRTVSAGSADGSCWMADHGGDVVVHFAEDGTELWQGAAFDGPWGTSVNTSDGSCWIGDRFNNQVVHLAADGTELSRTAGFSSPRGVSANSVDGSCWVADYGNNQVVHLSSDSSELWRGSGFSRPLAVSVNQVDGSCWVADHLNNQVVHLSAAGAELWRGDGFNRPVSVSVNSSNGTCWVADRDNNQVVHLAENGTELWRGGGFSGPRGVAVDESDRTCWVADFGNNQVVHLAPDGTELWRGGGFSIPRSVSVNQNDHTCWVADSGNGQVVHLASTRTLTLNGGNGQIAVDGVGRSLPYAEVFVKGTEVGLEAIPDATYEFSSWSGDLAGSDNPTAVTLDSDMSITAEFSKIYYTLDLQGVGNGTVFVDGVERALPWSALIAAGSLVALEAAPASCYEFAGWADDLSGSDSPTTITMDSPKLVTANFTKIQYALSLAGTGSGSVVVDGTTRTLPWSGDVDCGQVVVLEAVPDWCSEFISWSGDLTGSTSPTSVSMDSPVSITANFAPIEYTLSLSGVGEGSIVVDGTPVSLPWSGDFVCSTSVTLDVAPEPCWEFDSWSGDLSGAAAPKSLSMDGNKSVTATFTQIEHTLRITGSGDGAVRVDGLLQSLPWQDTYLCGATAIIEAVPDTCWMLENWSGDLSGGDSPVALTVDGDQSVQANFGQVTYTLSISGVGEGSILVDGVAHSLPWSGSVDCGSTATLEAVPDTCYRFDSWSGDLAGSDSPAAILVDSDKSITVTFDLLEYGLSLSGDQGGSVMVDGVEHALPWSGAFGCGTTVTLEAVPNTCWQFDGWTGDLSGSDSPVMLSIDGDKNVTATFSQIEYSLSVDGEGGSVIVDGVTQALPWSGAVLCGETVALEAVPDVHREFMGWSGDLSGSDNPTSIVVDSDKSVTVSFGWVSYALSITATGEGQVLVNGTPVALPWSQDYVYGTVVQLGAVAADGWKFSGWSGAVSGSASPVWVEVGGNTSVTATFIDLVTFLDIGDDHWALTSIAACVEAGIISGFPDGFYRPNLRVDRAAMAVYISRGLAGGNSGVPSGPLEASFPDVPADHWAYKHIEYAAVNAIVQGYGDGSYQPDRDVTRGQMSVFVARALVDPTGDEGLAGYTPPDGAAFPDVPTSYWCFMHVEYLFENEIVAGYPDGHYRPTGYVTRDQMAVYIARAFGLME